MSKIKSELKLRNFGKGIVDGYWLIASEEMGGWVFESSMVLKGGGHLQREKKGG